MTVHKEGSGEHISKGAVVKLNFKCKFLDGRVFSSSNGEPTEIPIGIGVAIKAWDVAVCGLQRGSSITV